MARSSASFRWSVTRSVFVVEYKRSPIEFQVVLSTSPTLTAYAEGLRQTGCGTEGLKIYVHSDLLDLVLEHLRTCACSCAGDVCSWRTSSPGMWWWAQKLTGP